MYKLIRSILFFFDAEKVHHFSMNGLKFLCGFRPLKKMIERVFNVTKVNRDGWHTTIWPFNLPFKNPLGLAAGFDKNAKYLRELETLGFGFVEIGTVTPLPQDGNDKPRLFRLPKDKALINRMGFNNDGVEKIASRLKLRKESGKPEPPTPNPQRLIIGGNIGKNKITPNESAWKDYETCFTALHPYVDYFVVNVSSPNTPGLRALQEKESLRKILTVLQEKNKGFEQQRPILLKISPDLSLAELDDVLDLATEINLDGLVAANTTIDRTGLRTSNSLLQQVGSGGLSGLPLQQRSTEMVKYISRKTKGTIPIIASGGIFTGADAAEKFAAGAALVQVWTGFVYKGPGIIKNILKNI